MTWRQAQRNRFLSDQRSMMDSPSALPVQITQDYFIGSGMAKRCVAKQGDKGWIWVGERDNVGLNVYVRVTLEGKKTKRQIPGWAIELVER